MPEPTYHDLGDHTEALQVDFDPRVIGYDALVAEFFRAHTPTRPPWSVQYRSAVFPSSDAQASASADAIAKEASRRGSAIHTALEPGKRFWLAEDYHQKYRLQGRDEFAALFAEYAPRAFVDSTVAARLNGYLSGYGTPADLEADLPNLALPERAVERLRAIVHAASR